ncbi:hypothetical protein [uncultured Sulfitobacter sp.]|uniref:hypothetical protein n=1 Tax=uncultured Sulfitobacter sp. TaxID=191468 RepID=UPI002619FB5D|nr:hypothetical protein [uncultured Sulfitobacter sp.]
MGAGIDRGDQGGDVAIGADGIAVGKGLDRIWHVATTNAQGFVLCREWLFSDIGKRIIVPVEITQAELGHILGYVAGIAPTDPGAPLQTQ